MSVISQVLLKADDELRYPTTGELQTISDFFQTGEQRLRIATTLAENEKRIVEQASKQLWQKRPDFISPGAMPTARNSVPSVCATMAGTCA